jgi:DNA-binding CsgD family transcriptional regulator
MRWVAAWHEGVRATSRPAWLIDLTSFRFVALSDAGAALFATTPEQLEGVSYLEVAEHPIQAANTFSLAQEGRIDALSARRGLRRRDGSNVEVQGSGRAVRSVAGPDMGLWVVDDSASPGAEPARSELPPEDLGQMSRRVPVVATVTLDDRWRVAHSSHPELVGTPIVDLVHPYDVSRLLMAFARTTTGPDTAVPVRLRNGHGVWETVWILVAMKVVGRTQSFTLDLRGGSQLTPGWSTEMGDLTERERQVVSRLLEGQRVATMAREMYISQKTIRNHLTAVFRKAGVHSQAELIDLLRRCRPTDAQ